MNSKIVFLFLMVISLSSCGVKGPPKAYPETIVDSYTKEYTGAEPTPEEKERMQNKTAIPSALDPQQPTNVQQVIKP